MCAVWKWCCLALFHCVKVFQTSVRRVSSYADILCSVEHSLLAFRARSSKLQVASSIWFSLKKYFKPNLRRLLLPTAYYGMKMEPFYPGRVLNLKKTRAKTNILMIHVDSNNMRRVYECYNSKIENVSSFHPDTVGFLSDANQSSRNVLRDVSDVIFGRKLCTERSR